MWSFYSKLEGPIKLELCHCAPLEICYCMVSFFFAKLKIFSFWPKTMDYSRGFWSKLRSFFVVLLRKIGRCYGAQTKMVYMLCSSFTADAIAEGGAFFGEGNGTIHLDRFFCVGAETAITDCGHSPSTLNVCTHSQDAGVTCSSEFLIPIEYSPVSSYTYVLCSLLQSSHKYTYRLLCSKIPLLVSATTYYP